MIYPFGGDSVQKFYWGTSEVLLPVYHDMASAVAANPEADTMVNFASQRSVYASVMEAFNFPGIRTIAIIAEGVPENKTRLLLAEARARGVTLIGPATVGGLKPGCFRIGNTGGMIDNCVDCKLHRPGSIAYVSRSGGMSNELNNIIAQVRVRQWHLIPAPTACTRPFEACSPPRASATHRRAFTPVTPWPQLGRLLIRSCVPSSHLKPCPAAYGSILTASMRALRSVEIVIQARHSGTT